MNFRYRLVWRCRVAWLVTFCGLVWPAGGYGQEPATAKDSESRRSTSELIRLLQAGPAEARIRSAEALGERNGDVEDSVPALTAALGDSDPSVRAAAAHALGDLGQAGRPALPQMLKLFTDRAPTQTEMPVWYEAAMAVGEFGKSAVEPLVPLLDPGEPLKCRAACIALHEIGEDAQAAVPALAKVLEARDPEVAKEALHAVMGLGPAAKDALPQVIQALDMDDMHSQYFACRALASMGELAAPATADLIRKMATGVTSVRRNAAIALGSIGPSIGEPGIRSLQAGLDDFVVVVREEALIGLGKLGGKAQSAAEPLRLKIESGKLTPPGLANVTYWQITGDLEFVKPRLVKLFGDPDDAIEVSQQLARMGPSAAFATPQLIEATRSQDPVLRLVSIQALHAIGDSSEEVLAAVRMRLIDPDADVRDAAVSAVKSLTSSVPPGQVDR